jgi:hypothetical protein
LLFKDSKTNKPKEVNQAEISFPTATRNSLWQELRLLDEHGQEHIPPPQAAKLKGFKVPNMVPKAYLPSCGSSNAS